MLIWVPFVHSSVTEWDQPVAEYIFKTCHSFYCCQEAVMAKNGAFIE
jgi:hypothetical protein